MHLGSKLVWSLKHGARKFAQMSYYLLQMLKVQKPLGGRDRPDRWPEENLILNPQKKKKKCAKGRIRVQACMVTGGCHKPETKTLWGQSLSWAGATFLCLRISYQLLHNKFGGLNQYTFIISQFLCMRNIWLQLSYDLCFRVFHEASVRLQPGLWSNLKAQMGKEVTPSSHHCWQDLVSWRLWVESLLSLLAVDWRLPSSFLPCGSPHLLIQRKHLRRTRD